MNKIEDAVKAYKNNLKALLQEEVGISGGSYQKWYDALEPFRTYMESKYVGRKLGKQLYTIPYVYNKYGDYLDHHLLSYIAPLEFKRVGWNNEIKRPVDQIHELSEWFGMGGGRLVYVALPNKGMVYPQLICDDEKLYSSGGSVTPQWRKYVNDISNTETEIIDLYPVFKEHASKYGMNNPLFTKEHNISAVGAKLIADTIADYLKETTVLIEETCKIEQESHLLYPYNLINSKVPSFIDKYYINKIKEGDAYLPYWNQKIESEIAIFGDCSLQSHAHLGAGIAANLAYNLQTHIYDGGRQLIFDTGQRTVNEISIENLWKMRRAKISIYVAFASASFVRSSVFLTRTPKAVHIFDRPRQNYTWSTINLK